MALTSKLFVMTMGLVISLATAVSAADHSRDYLSCYTSDLTPPPDYYSPIVSTLIVSPEVNGKRYYTSWISEQKEGGKFAGRGPQELQSFSVDDNAISFGFIPPKDPTTYYFLAVKAEADSRQPNRFESTIPGEVTLMYPKKTIFGKTVATALRSKTTLVCMWISESEIIGDSGSVSVTIGTDFSQLYHFDDMTYVSQWSRSLQGPLLLDFIKKL